MSDADLPETIAALQRELVVAAGRPVAVLHTHISWVLLDGQSAWKVKKPVDLGFIDCRSLARRRQLCDEELRLNRRTAPGWYEAVVPIVARAGRVVPSAQAPAAGTDVLEYAVKMRQFPVGALLSEQLAAGRLDRSVMERFGERLAVFHRSVDDRVPVPGYGDAAAVRSATDQLLQRLTGFGVDVDSLRVELDRQARALQPFWTQRRQQGFVRECHGDLHLGNVALLEDEPTAFDAIDFEPQLRWIDVCSDVAFMFMDLLAHGRRDLAFDFVNAWLQASGDYDAVTTLRYYATYRALVRALVGRIRGAQSDATAADGPDYLAVARAICSERDPRLLVTVGVSGSGKSWMAHRLSEEAGALWLRSDVERKRLRGVQALARSRDLGLELYDAQTTADTYRRLRECADRALRAGWRVIIDAACLDRGQRAPFVELASTSGVPWSLLHCRAAAETLRGRVVERLAARSDPSEADLDVLDRQLARDPEFDGSESVRTIAIDTDSTLEPSTVASRWLAAR